MTLLYISPTLASVDLVLEVLELEYLDSGPDAHLKLRTMMKYMNFEDHSSACTRTNRDIPLRCAI